MIFIKNHLKQGDYIFFLLSIAFLPLSIKLSSKLLFIAIILGLIKSIYFRQFKWYLNQKPVILFYTTFIIYIVLQGLLLDGPNLVFNTFDRAYAPYLVFLLVPIFYNKTNITELIPLALLAGVFTLLFLILFYSLLDGELYSRETVLKVFDIHHLYISLYLLFLINFLLSSERRIRSKSKVIMILVMGCFLIFFKSKAAIGITIILLLYHAVMRLKLNTIRRIGLGLFTMTLFLIFNNFFYKVYIGAVDFRSRIWEAAIDRIIQKPLFGYGSLKEYDALNRTHFLNADYDFLDFNLNSHNLFLTVLLKFGLIGLVLIIVPFFYPLFKLKGLFKIEFIGFLLIFCSMGFIESLFNRHHGIVFSAMALYFYYTMVSHKNRSKV